MRLRQDNIEKFRGRYCCKRAQAFIVYRRTLGERWVIVENCGDFTAVMKIDREED